MIFGYAPTPALAVVKVGNGGDVVTASLHSSASALRELLVAEASGGGALAAACRVDADLDPARREECVAFAKAAARELVPGLLARATPLRLTREPLEVEGPDGEPRPVQAYTECPIEAPIVFSFDAVRSFAPAQLLRLTAHEFGHKVRYAGGRCVADSDAVGPFDTEEGGRALLDAFGKAAAVAARRSGLIGDELGVQDTFECVWSSGPFKATQLVRSDRRFPSPGTFDAYSAGIFDSDLRACSFQVGESTYAVRLTVREADGCLARPGAGRRGTRAELVRFGPARAHGGGPRIDVVEERTFEGENPLCSEPTGTPSLGPIAFELRGSGDAPWPVRVEVEYAGSQALLAPRSL